MDLLKAFEIVALVVAVVSGLAGLLGAWFIIPYRVQKLEEKVDSELAQIKKDHDLLIEIRTQSENTRSQIAELSSSVNMLRGEFIHATRRAVEAEHVREQSRK